MLAVLLGRLSPAKPQAYGMLGPRTLRQRLGRWQQAGWVERRRLLGHTWVLPTRTGLRLAGLQFDPWEPAESRLAHHHAVALVRLHREAAPGQSGVGVRAGAVAPSRQGELASVRQRPPRTGPGGLAGD